MWNSGTFFFNLIYFGVPWVFVIGHELSLVAVSMGCSLVAVHGPLVVGASLVVEHRR